LPTGTLSCNGFLKNGNNFPITSQLEIRFVLIEVPPSGTYLPFVAQSVSELLEQNLPGTLVVSDL